LLRRESQHPMLRRRRQLRKLRRVARMLLELEPGVTRTRAMRPARARTRVSFGR